jgi:uncharacterized protein YndB with AHSA1/START domain
MNETTLLRAIEVDAVLPHEPALIWRAMTDGALIGRWLMPPTGFAAVVGQEFSFSTTPAGSWDGRIRCRVLEVEPEARLVFSWDGGADDNIGYGSRLRTRVTMTLTVVAGGTRLQVRHEGFALPRNATAYENMNKGWQTVVGRLSAVVSDV